MRRGQKKSGNWQTGSTRKHQRHQTAKTEDAPAGAPRFMHLKEKRVGHYLDLQLCLQKPQLGGRDLAIWAGIQNGRAENVWAKKKGKSSP
jgi:hypothetical protein